MLKWYCGIYESAIANKSDGKPGDVDNHLSWPTIYINIMINEYPFTREINEEYPSEPVLSVSVYDQQLSSC